jgi:hypothetical protein
MTRDGLGGVSGRSGRAIISAGQLGPSQLTRRGMVMEFSINRAVDDSGLESGVGVTKYRGCHRTIRDEVLTTAECVDVVHHPSAAMA